MDESFIDRLSALKDVIPPAQRRKLGLVTSATKEWGWWGMQMAGKSLWVLSASVLLLGVPWALSSTEDQQIAMEEKLQMQQQSANDVSTLSLHGWMKDERAFNTAEFG